jgi:hypothetical protein
VAHGNTVIDGNGVEFLGDSTGRFNLPRNQLTQVHQVDVAGHKLGEGVHHGNDGFAKITVFHSCGAPQGTGAGHIAAVGGGLGAIFGHGLISGGLV